MTNEQKQTPGPATLGNEDNTSAEVCVGETTIDLTRMDHQGRIVIERDEMLANAHFIIDAFNVAQQTGLSPKLQAMALAGLSDTGQQLTADRDRLWDALVYAVAEIEALYRAAAKGSIKAEISLGQFGRLARCKAALAGTGPSEAEKLRAENASLKERNNATFEQCAALLAANAELLEACKADRALGITYTSSPQRKPQSPSMEPYHDRHPRRRAKIPRHARPAG